MEGKSAEEESIVAKARCPRMDFGADAEWGAAVTWRALLR